MQLEKLTDERVDQALRRQPRWEPPRHFIRAVIARMTTVTPVPPLPMPHVLPVALRAATVGLLGGSMACGFGLLLSRATFELLPRASSILTAYEMLLEATTAALIDHVTMAAWITAALILSIAASASGRAREWI